MPADAPVTSVVWPVPLRVSVMATNYTSASTLCAFTSPLFLRFDRDLVQADFARGVLFEHDLVRFLVEQDLRRAERAPFAFAFLRNMDLDERERIVVAAWALADFHKAHMAVRHDDNAIATVFQLAERRVLDVPPEAVV